MKQAIFAIALLALFCLFWGHSAIAQDGLVGYWKFDEGAGDEAGDSSEAGNHGVFVGNIEWVEGKFDSALEFSESQSCVKIEHSESINFLTAFTITLWARPAESQPSYGKLICKQKTGEYPYAIQYDSPGEQIRGTVNASARFDTPGIPNFTEWAHLALTYDGEVELLYRDGAEVARKVATGDLQQNDLELTIGSRLDSSQSFVGALDDVRLYDFALFPDEIQEAMAEPISFAVGSHGKLAITWGMIKK